MCSRRGIARGRRSGGLSGNHDAIKTGISATATAEGLLTPGGVAFRLDRQPAARAGLLLVAVSGSDGVLPSECWM
jgi:hypothetical protein